MLFCWEIASNFNCNLESQLGFQVEEGKINLGFLGVEGKTIPWCKKKKFNPCQRSNTLFFIDGIGKSLINR